ncbi:MAG TPA: hypothetical protein VMZ26_09315 [Pyrinomonadaceae bacterium]|nr:hypothetical protein [Pyrinomonadaceae bacterium]
MNDDDKMLAEIAKLDKRLRTDELERLYESTFYGDLAHPQTLGPSKHLIRVTKMRQRRSTHVHDDDNDVEPARLVREYLRRQPAYVRHKPAVRSAVRRNRMLAKGVGTDYQADLADVQQLASDNRGARYLLCVIDILSKRAQVEPIRAKTGSEVRDAFERMLRKDPLLADSHVATDAGKEFLNEPVQQWFREHQIVHYTLQGDHKAAVVERFQRTFKERLHRLMTARNSYKYLDALPSIVHSYNHAPHRTLRGMRPVDVGKHNERELYERQFSGIDPKKHVTRGPKDDIREGDTVLISVAKNVFEKGYTGKWRVDEPFTVVEVKQGVPNKQYVLRDENGEPIQGAFYREQLQPIDPQPK